MIPVLPRTRQRTSPQPLAAITGAGSGIGRAMAHEFSRTHRLLIADVAEERLSAAQRELARAGSQPSSLVCDVTQLEYTERLARRALELGPVSVLVHAAGISPSMGDAATVITVNYAGTAHMLAAFEPTLDTGSVTLCIASMSGYRRGLDRYEDLVREPFSAGILQGLIEASLGQPGAAYALSKRAVMRLVERQARRWAAWGPHPVDFTRRDRHAHGPPGNRRQRRGERPCCWSTPRSRDSGRPRRSRGSPPSWPARRPPS